MDRARHFLGQKRIDATLARDSAVAGKSRGDDLDMKMRLALRARAGMAGMTLGIVADDEPRRLQRGGELGSDAIGDTHASEARSGHRGVKANSRRGNSDDTGAPGMS